MGGLPRSGTIWVSAFPLMAANVLNLLEIGVGIFASGPIASWSLMAGTSGLLTNTPLLYLTDTSRGWIAWGLVSLWSCNLAIQGISLQVNDPASNSWLGKFAFVSLVLRIPCALGQIFITWCEFMNSRNKKD